MKQSLLAALIGLAAASSAFAQMSPMRLNFSAPSVVNKENLTDVELGSIVLDTTNTPFGFYGKNGTGTLDWVQLGGAAGTTASTSLSYEISNLSFASSVTSNALTVDLKDRQGNNPSPSSPVAIAFRDATSTSGLYYRREITAALSLTISSGSTLGCVSAVECLVYLYAIDTGAGVELGVAGVLLDEGSVQTSTAEGGAGGADSASTLYSTSAHTLKPVRLIGRVRATEATAGTWLLNATEIATVPFKTQPTVPGYPSTCTDCKFEAVTLTGCGSSTGFTQKGDWVTSVATISTGKCTMNIKSGVFTSAPFCTCSQNYDSGGNMGFCMPITANASATRMDFHIYRHEATVINHGLRIICVGN